MNFKFIDSEYYEVLSKEKYEVGYIELLAGVWKFKSHSEFYTAEELFAIQAKLLELSENRSNS